MNRVSLGTEVWYGTFQVKGYQNGTGDRQAAYYEVVDGNGGVIADGMSLENARLVAKALDYFQMMTP